MSEREETCTLGSQESAVELFVEAASGSGAQVGEHGQDAAVAVFGVGDVELGEQPTHVGLDRALAEEQPLATPALA